MGAAAAGVAIEQASSPVARASALVPTPVYRCMIDPPIYGNYLTSGDRPGDEAFMAGNWSGGWGPARSDWPPTLPPTYGDIDLDGQDHHDPRQELVWFHHTFSSGRRRDHPAGVAVSADRR